MIKWDNRVPRRRGSLPKLIPTAVTIAQLKIMDATDALSVIGAFELRDTILASASQKFADI